MLVTLKHLNGEFSHTIGAGEATLIVSVSVMAPKKSRFRSPEVTLIFHFLFSCAHNFHKRIQKCITLFTF